MTSSTALVLGEIGGPFSLEQVKVDKIQDDEALIEIVATGICHTDLSCAEGTLPASAPAVLGHEGTLPSVIVHGGIISQCHRGRICQGGWLEPRGIRPW